MKLTPLYRISLLLLLLLLGGCSNQYSAEINDYAPQIGERLEILASNLDSKALANGRLLEEYGQRVALLKPELAAVAEQLAQDATRSGALYQGLMARYLAVNREPDTAEEYQKALFELESLHAATDLALFNDSLIDQVNTLANLSGGQLARVELPKEELTASKTTETVAGSHLVGNPTYGQWKEDSSGTSFWEFYGQYTMLNQVVNGLGQLIGGRRIEYDDWNSRPRYSHYRDYGWKTYGSYQDYRRNESLNERMQAKGRAPAQPLKSYGSAEGSQRLSSYLSRSSERSQPTRSSSRSDGPRHASSANKRGSSLFSSSSSSSGRGSNASSGSTTSSSSSSKRSSSLFGGSARSSRSSSSSFSRGGK